MGRRVPVRGVSRPLAWLAAVAALSTVVAAPAAVYGARVALETLAILAPLGALTVVAVHLLLRASPRLTSVRRRFAIVCLLGAAQLAVAVTLFWRLMFVSAMDALFTVLVTTYAAVLGVWAARQLGRQALGELDVIRGTLAAVGDGRRDVRTGIAGRDEIARVAADVDQTIARLGAEENARRTLIAAVSHDLRTPITSLQLLADAIDDEIADAETRRGYAARMGTHVRALAALIDDLFELTRLESGELQWTMQRVRLDALVQETVEAMLPAAEAQAISMRAELAEGLEPTAANPERLQRVLFNLLQNAIRHTPADGSVTVRAVAVDGGVEVEVADDGTGIAADDRPRVFEPFFRGGSDAARSDTGAGLGLAISRAIVEAHGGRMWLEDVPAGTAVRFRLPAAATA
jgi:signal transduction histidine kinase